MKLDYTSIELAVESLFSDNKICQITISANNIIKFAIIGMSRTSTVKTFIGYYTPNQLLGLSTQQIAEKVFDAYILDKI